MLIRVKIVGSDGHVIGDDYTTLDIFLADNAELVDIDALRVAMSHNDGEYRVDIMGGMYCDVQRQEG